MASERQLVSYTFLKVAPAAFGRPPDERRAAASGLAAILDQQAAAGTVLTYSTVGLRGDCDMLVWQAGNSPEELQARQTAWRASALWPFLTIPHNFLAMMRPSPYLRGHRHPDQEGARRRLKPAGTRYLFVYPMVKKRVWYRLPFERRKAMMVEHFAIGHRYPQVKINTAYSFGLDDQEFVVAFESDDPAAFLDLVTELRESQASRYTERETPIFSCVRMPPAEALELALGLGRSAEAAVPELAGTLSLAARG